MNIDDNRIKELLTLLVEAYPNSVENWSHINETLGDTSLVAHLVYLRDHGYIEGEFKFLGNTSPEQWFIDFARIRLNAKGLDYSVNRINPTGGMLVRR